MSEREKALQLLDKVPDYKLEYVIAFYRGLQFQKANQTLKL